MEIAAINSLAEVGVGLNLAIGMLRGIRVSLSGLFNSHFQTELDKVLAGLNELDPDVGGQVALRAGNVKDSYNKSCYRLEAATVVLALASASFLIFLLYESSLDPRRDEPAAIAMVTLALAVGPLILALCMQLISFQVAHWRLRIQANKFHEFEDIMRAARKKISPKDPKVPTGQPRQDKE